MSVSLPGATISTLVVGYHLRDAKWIPKQIQLDRYRAYANQTIMPSSILTLPQAFACVAMFESGTCNIDPSYLQEAYVHPPLLAVFLFRERFPKSILLSMQLIC